MTNVCKDPDCRKVYVVEDEKSDDGYCSFKCWENVLCQNPPVEVSEEFVLDLP